MVAQSDFIITTQNLTKTYGRKPVVDRLNLAVPRGSICGFLGSNGAGKSTTIKLLLGLVKPSSGVGTVFGKDIVRDSIAIRERVGFLAQAPYFYGYLTARETLQFVASFFFKGSRAAIAARIEELIELVGLSGKADRPVRGFSGGERQRLGIAQAAINDPELIILDEPAAALDPLGRRNVLQILERFRGQSTVFYSTHILDDVQRVSDMVAILERGRLVAQDTIDQLLSGDRNLFSITVRGDGRTVCDRLKRVPWVKKTITTEVGVLGVEHHTTKLQVQVTNPNAAETELLRLVMADPTIIVTQFGRISYDLEDVFVDLVERELNHEQ
ncbi:ABC transporter ATP-binding protein [Gloeocapsopsis crepidinum LEGE 06123]|uniref:ABC transporter ATP-binding protein n=2 Tax=Gloeocapsopsis crepidinum TaxID=693223 RepID=A0ABR9ULA3_9CHRO|nr:ABC transporter ATP-binding protein [Gloeocapsopsis crepidinum]MBE9189067.1 ABC transporter ATP-binding protein [Gloeocapsopsis crepidinum LEGE 06123]